MQLRYYQEEAVQAVFDYWMQKSGNPLVDLATGCHAAGTKIMMHDGSSKLVEMVGVGDLVMGPDSKPRKVLSLARGREMMYKVTPKKGEAFVVNEGHILSLKTTGTGPSKAHLPSALKAGTVENIKLSEYLTKNKTWKHLRKLWRTGVDFAERQESNDIPPWVLGVFLGDGHIKTAATLCNPDHEILDGIADYAESIGLDFSAKQKAGSPAYQLNITDKNACMHTKNKLVSLLEDIGVLGTLSDNKFIPDSYKLGTRKERLEILAGLLDTDGHLEQSKCVFDYVSKSKQLAQDVVFVSRSLGLAAYVKETQKYCQTGGGGTYWRVCISGDIEIIPTRIKRKQASQRQQKKNPLVTGFSVEEVGIDDYFGFELDGDHLYLTEDFTVHHNTGKSLVLSDIIRRLITNWPDMRIMVVTHVAEIIEQNYQEFVGVMPFADAGIYSAGLGQRNAHSQVIFGGVQTVYNKAFQIGHIDVVLIDEAHLVPRKSNTQYGCLISDLKSINPDLKIVGLTATPYRLDSGRLDEGEDRLFDDVVYTYGIADGVRDGYLSRLSTMPTSFEYDTRGVGKLGGDYKQNALQAAVNTDDKNRIVAQEIICSGQDRRSWMIFCSGVEHAFAMRQEIRRNSISCETVTGETPKGERRDIFEAFKNYEIRSLSVNTVGTIGFNHKGVDLIADCQPTLSASRFVQKAGRGTRVLYAPNMPLDTDEQRKMAIAAGPKSNCLYLDFAKAINTHGPVDCVTPKKPGKGDGEAPFKVCPQDQGGCGEKVHTTARECPNCGFEFEIDTRPKIDAKAADVPIMSTAEPEKRDVSMRTFRYHEGKGDKPPTVKVTYMCGLNPINEWLCPEHSGYAKTKADRYWAKHGGTGPFPTSVLEWLERQNELKETTQIEVEPSGRYWVPVKHTVGDFVADNDNQPSAQNDNNFDNFSDFLDDEIPF